MFFAVFVGLIGGVFSGVAGSGVDIWYFYHNFRSDLICCKASFFNFHFFSSFSVLCLLFRVSEKVSTPTSIILMAINTCVGSYLPSRLLNKFTWHLTRITHLECISEFSESCT